jgi:hypothetical protein
VDGRRETTTKVRAAAWPSRVMRLVALAPVVVILAACSSDVFDVDVALSSHPFNADFSPSNGTIPTITCDPTMPGLCGLGQVLAVTTSDGSPADVNVDVGCDSGTNRCFAEAHARLVYELDVLQDDAFVTKVERRAISFVRMLDIAYTMPTNTLTFAVPRVDVYVGPMGARTESDAGVSIVDSITSIGAGTTFVDEPRHLMLADGSPARTLIEQNVQSKTPFVFMLVTAPRLEAGAPAPGGAFEIDLVPTVRLGFPP